MKYEFSEIEKEILIAALRKYEGHCVAQDRPEFDEEADKAEELRVMFEGYPF